MKTIPKLNKGRITAELAVIVVGVLIALFVDGWRESVQERERALQMLADVQLDLVADSIEIARHADIYPVQLAALRELIEIDRNPRPTHARLVELNGLIARMTPDRWNTSGYSALLGGGDLRLIEDPAITRALGRYYSRSLSGARSEAAYDARLGAEPIWKSQEAAEIFDPFSVDLQGRATYAIDTTAMIEWAQQHRTELVGRAMSLTALLSFNRRLEEERLAVGQLVAAYLAARGAL